MNLYDEKDFEDAADKPPLGLTPIKNWEQGKDKERIADIVDAMTRYSENEKVIPLDWISELWGRVTNLGG